MIVIAIVLQFLDALTTYLALRRPTNKEGNPVMRWLFATFGLIPGLIIAKAVGVAVLAATAYFESTPAIVVTIVIYTVVVINNTRLAIK
jgi:hypothetical protein